MNTELTIRPEAESDLASAYDWYEEQATGLGLEFLASIEATFASISENSRRYPIVYGDVRRALARRFPYQVYYIDTTTTISVLAVMHERRDPKLWRDRV